MTTLMSLANQLRFGTRMRQQHPIPEDLRAKLNLALGLPERARDDLELATRLEQVHFVLSQLTSR